jgi:hypothetical protein
MSEESIFTTASKFIHQTRQKEKQFDPRSHLNPKTQVTCPNNFNTIEDIRDWLHENRGRHVVCDSCTQHNCCLLEMDAYLKLASKEARTQ